MKVKYYVNTIGLYRTFQAHTQQFGILINDMKKTEKWNDQNINPPTCPYNTEITYESDKV